MKYNKSINSIKKWCAAKNNSDTDFEENND